MYFFSFCFLLFCQQKIVSNNDKNERASTLAGNEGDERKCTRILVVIFVAETNDAKKTYTYDTINEWKKREWRIHDRKNFAISCFLYFILKLIFEQYDRQGET